VSPQMAALWRQAQGNEANKLERKERRKAQELNADKSPTLTCAQTRTNRNPPRGILITPKRGAKKETKRSESLGKRKRGKRVTSI